MNSDEGDQREKVKREQRRKSKLAFLSWLLSLWNGMEWDGKRERIGTATVSQS